jgi:hypothetical protein
MVNEMCPKCDARNVTLLEFRYLPGSKAPVKMCICLNRFCRHRWPILTLAREPFSAREFTSPVLFP